MKKKTIANLTMVLIIVLLAVGGTAIAFALKQTDDTGLGSLYGIEQIPGNCLITLGEEENLCTITILCDTVLDHTDTLNPEKAPYVPTDAVILPETTVSFKQGDTVFEVLQKVCNEAKIQLEYSWTPLYDSYYIEGINHLYEFDCGIESGWMYKVNDWFPNYGCSSYSVKNGDEIVWCYTCVGLGTDVGDVWMGEEG